VNLAPGSAHARYPQLEPCLFSFQPLPEHRKRKLWEVDPSIFQHGHKESFLERRILPPLRQLGKFGLYALALTYPIYLIYVGLAFGGLAFWGFLAGSFVVVGVIITRLGYASNFRHWDVSLRRTIGLVLGLALSVGFYSGLFYLKTLFVPAAFGIAAVGLFLVLRRSKS
jgi:hypothetical protein